MYVYVSCKIKWEKNSGIRRAAVHFGTILSFPLAQCVYHERKVSEPPIDVVLLQIIESSRQK